MKSININKLLLVFIVFCAPLVMAHDTTHIHPMITDRTATLIQNKDVNGNYAEIYQLGPTNEREYWGTDQDTRVSVFSEAYLLEDQLGLYTSYDNVMDGVVQEDAPVDKVLHHFFQARSGIELRLNGISLGGDPSSNRAMVFFKNAISFYGGYSEQAKHTSYFVFGQALHHVEDMSSPAHIHNDAHLTFEETEKDDYEGWYLPFEKVLDDNLEFFFRHINDVRRIDNPWVGIWGIRDSDNSMVRFFHDRTTYQGNLDFPTTVTDDIDGYVYVVTPAATPALPTGELREMFPCEDTLGNRDTTVPNCLHWVEDNLQEVAHWEINSVGKFQHQYAISFHNDWWPLEQEINPVVNNTGRIVTFGDRFYLEQLSKGNSETNVSGTSQVVPTNMRTNFLVPYTSTNTGMVSNDRSILEIRAESLLAPAVEFSAGFTMHWFDIANTPPYLKEVRVSQAPKDSFVPEFIYTANWSEITSTIPFTHHNVDDCTILGLSFGGIHCSSTTRQVEMHESRRFALDAQSLTYIHGEKQIRLTAEFNEPIENITQIGFGNFDGLGNCLSITTGCLDFTPPEVVVGGSYDLNGETIQLSKELDGARWIFILPDTVINALNGKLPLTVKAIDKNNHNDGEGGTAGAELDGTPATPARRNMNFGGDQHDPGRNFYPWYKDSGADPESNDAKYSYDPEDGDTNHVLLFDTASPSAVINVDTVLPN